MNDSLGNADNNINLDSTDMLIGYASLLISCAAFGFMFAPLKGLDTKDGVFVQWVQCSVVFMAGFVINVVRGLPPFNLIASIGGFLYATGNVASVPIVAEMGIGLGMLIWGSVQIIVGWCVAHFGLFGTKSQSVQSPLMNYLGVLLTLLSGLMFVFVYSEEGEAEGRSDSDRRVSANVPLNFTNDTGNDRIRVQQTDVGEGGRRRPPYGSMNENVWAIEEQQIPVHDMQAVHEDGHAANDRGNSVFHEEQQQSQTTNLKNRLKSLNLSKRKLFFIGLAVCLGSLHGLMMTPIVYIQDSDPKASKNVLDYVFSHFSAVFFFSTFYFILYSLVKCGKPFIHTNLVLPAVLYGILWTIGMTLFIVSNRLLSQTVSFPITVRLPAIIGALTDVLIFRSIGGKQRLCFLFIAILVGSIGVVLVGISLY